MRIKSELYRKKGCWPLFKKVHQNLIKFGLMFQKTSKPTHPRFASCHILFYGSSTALFNQMTMQIELCFQLQSTVFLSIRMILRFQKSCQYNMAKYHCKLLKWMFVCLSKHALIVVCQRCSCLQQRCCYVSRSSEELPDFSGSQPLSFSKSIQKATEVCPSVHTSLYSRRNREWNLCSPNFWAEYRTKVW